MSTLSFAQNTEIPYNPPTFSASKLYNIIFPIMLIGSFLYMLVMLFITPTSRYIGYEAKTVTPKILGNVQKALGTVSMFGLKDPYKPGAISK
jgi:hypothetical protein